ncbi:MAG: Fe-S cluster assembly protein NifU [Succinivibrionaceae bacterium]
MWDYSDKVKDYFFHPRNAKEVKDANATGDVGSIVCGDALRLQLKVNPETEIIEDAGFQTFGCGSAIASSSALTEMVIGKTLDEASKITNKDIADYLDGLPPEKMHCSVMGREALDAAIANYRGIKPSDAHVDSPLVCKCFGIDEAKIVREVVENNLTTIQDVINYTKAGGACGSCHEKIEKILEGIKRGDYAGKYVTTNMEAVKQVAEKIHQEIQVGNTTHPLWKPIYDLLAEIRPNLQADGGDIELLHVENDHIDVQLSGHCVGCMMEEMTTSFIRNLIKERLGVDVVINTQNNAR